MAQLSKINSPKLSTIEISNYYIKKIEKYGHSICCEKKKKKRIFKFMDEMRI